MSKKIKPSDNAANMQNANKGTSGTNKQYKQTQSNKAKQQQLPNTNKKK